MGENKRKKHHDKDKYYRFAKEQGLRSRAAFKLNQINKKFGVLSNVQNCILDLCAAPGGWTQICARTVPRSVTIVAVDILPIRSLGRPNVTTLIGDITTQKCKSDIQRTVAAAAHTGTVELVLHDGAPNVGADYGKDAYEQNEIALHALRTATQHLSQGGTFVTKVYRSRDYAALNWVLYQLFDDVQAFKPAASRQQSAEIFVVCQGYKAPIKLDPRLLDPKHVFETVEGETTGGSMALSGATSGSGAGTTIFHKNWDKPQRKRGGYDMTHLDATMRHLESVASFVNSGGSGSSNSGSGAAVTGLKRAIDMLSTSTGMTFECPECSKDQSMTKNANKSRCSCSFLQNHPFTTTEIKECLSDLQVLNKSDFKGLLTWRTKMQDALKARRSEDDGTDDVDMEDADASSGDDDNDDDGAASEDSDREESEIQAEIEEMRNRRQRERKRRKKKERAAAAKRRRHAALGMDLNAIEVPEHDKIFSLSSITSKRQLARVSEVNLDEVDDEELFGGKEDEDDDVVVGGNVDGAGDSDSENENVRRDRRERDLDEAYTMYLSSTKDNMAKSGTKMAKRSKKLERLKAAEEANEDQEMALTGAEGRDYDAKTYAKMLQGNESDDEENQVDDSSDDDDDGFTATPMTPSEHSAQKKKSGENPLIHKFADEATSVKTARWFSNPLFESIGRSAQDSSTDTPKMDIVDNSSDEENEKKTSAAPRKRRKMDKLDVETEEKITAQAVLDSMPKTDKQKRHEKRLKTMERDERKKARKAKQLGDTEKGFQLVPGNASDSEDDGETDNMEHLSESQRKRVVEARELIKAGLGKTDDRNVKSGIEIVSQQDSQSSGNRPLPIMDDRKFDSDNEDYDSDDYAKTLALGTMMLRRSKEKSFVDSSYNRYAWNDPSNLPDWFVDDENKHYRPQLPIPPALIAKMKEKMLALSTKPIAKVAEARARKSKRAKDKLASAKKKAEAVANSGDMSEAMKLKAISKALQGQGDSKNSGKQYVVAKKGRTTGGKGTKLVDKRMRSDKRSMERSVKKKKNGKQNKMVGGKKRKGGHK